MKWAEVKKAPRRETKCNVEVDKDLLKNIEVKPEVEG
jgi:hypothetical protein